MVSSTTVGSASGTCRSLNNDYSPSVTTQARSTITVERTIMSEADDHVERLPPPATWSCPVRFFNNSFAARYQKQSNRHWKFSAIFDSSSFHDWARFIDARPIAVPRISVDARNSQP
jgi:hypothetical protein